AVCGVDPATQQLLEMFDRLDRGLGADDPDDYFEKVLEAIKQHPLFDAFESEMQVEYENMWCFAEDPQSASEDADAFREFLADQGAVVPAGSQAAAHPLTSKTDGNKVPPSKLGDLASAGRQASNVAGSDSESDSETNRALQAVQDAFRRAPAVDIMGNMGALQKSGQQADEEEESVSSSSSIGSGSLLKAEEPVQQDNVDFKLKPPASFDDSFAWFFLREAWPKLSLEERQNCRRNVTKSTHALGERVSRGAGSRLPIERFKKNYLLKTVHPLLTRSGPAEDQHGCLFAEFGDLACGQAFCEKHQRVCVVHEVPFLIICGYSCKNLSKLNASSRAGVLRAGLGSSGETCDHLLNYLSSFRPAVALLENVEEMARDSEDSDNVAYFLGRLEEMDYAFATKLLDSSNYGLPQKRLRSFQILLNRRVFESADALDKIAQKMMSTAVRLACGKPESLRFFLDADDDPYVEAEFFRKIDAQQKLAHATQERHAQETWRQKHREFFASKKVAWSQLVVPADIQNSPWFGSLSSREKETLAWGLMSSGYKPEGSEEAATKSAAGLDCADKEEQPDSAASQEIKSNKDSADSHRRQEFRFVAVDLSQRIDRVRTSTAGPIFTMLPSQKVWIWSSLHNRLLTGREALRLQGYPLEPGISKDEISDPQMADLAGNAFPATVVMALLLGIYSHLPDYVWTDDENVPAVSRPRMSEPEELQLVLQGLDDSD
ncbi:unnamed protein product, partial [Symbiodinium sp. CCMP2456]